MYNTFTRLYNLKTYFDEYNSITNVEKEVIDKKYDPINLFLRENDYSKWCGKEDDEADEEGFVNIEPMLLPEGNEEEVKEKGKGLKMLTPNKVLTRLPVLLAQIKVGNNSYKLRNEISKILYFLYQHNKITKMLYNNLIKSL